MSRECVKSWSLVTRASSESQARPNGSEPGSATAEPLVDLTDGNKKQEEGQEEEKEKDTEEEDKEGEVQDKEEVQEEDEEKQVEIEVEVLEDPMEFQDCMEPQPPAGGPPKKKKNQTNKAADNDQQDLLEWGDDDWDDWHMGQWWSMEGKWKDEEAEVKEEDVENEVKEEEVDNEEEVDMPDDERMHDGSSSYVSSEEVDGYDLTRDDVV